MARPPPRGRGGAPPAAAPAPLRALLRGALPLLLLVPPAAQAGKISAISLETAGGRTSIAFESDKKIRFTVYILRNPDRVLLELENTPLDAGLSDLAARVAAGHPHLKPIQVRPYAPADGNVRLEFAFKAESEVETRLLEPSAAHGHRLVLDIVPQAVPQAALPAAPPPAPQVAMPASQAPAPPAAPQAVVPAAPAPPPPSPAPAVAAPAPPPAPSPVPQAALPALPARAPARQLPPAASDEPALTLLEVRLDTLMLAEAITSYRQGGATLLPLGELARLLTLSIRTQPALGTAGGFVLQETNTFSLNVAQARVTLAEQSQLYDPALVRVEGDDIYVASTLLARWLPLELDIDLSSLTLRVRPRQPLPLQQRLARERQGDQTGVRDAGAVDPGYPRHATPYRLLGVPSIDQTLGLGLKGDRARQGGVNDTANYTAYLTGDLLGMEAALYVASSLKEPSPDARLTLARHDPDAGLLGPLRARSLVFGSTVSMPGMPNVAGGGTSGKGIGLSLSNRPLNQPTSFDRHTLRGDLPPGWDVELFFNEALIGFQRARADGRYSFDDQPLSYGANEFRLVFHGPLGQQRVERQSFLLESGTPPGAFYYNVAQYRDSASRTRSSAQLEWGVGKHLSATGGLTHLPALAGGGGVGGSAAGGLYASLGLRAFWRGFIFSSDFTSSPGDGWLNESGLKTRLGGVAVSYSRTVLDDFSSELFAPNGNALATRDKLRLDGALPAPLRARLPFTLEVQRDQSQSGPAQLAVSARLAAHVRQVSMSNQMSWQRRGADGTAGGVFQLSSRSGELGLIGQLGYSVRPHASLDTVALSADRRFGAGYLLNLGVVRAIAARQTLATAGLNKSFGSYGLGLSASYAGGGAFSAALQLFIALSREPRTARWRFDALPKADSGGASVRVFLDDNSNGVMDGAEEAIANVALTVNGSRAPLRTDAAGIAWLDRLPIRQGVNIALDAQTLEDPSWVPQRKGARLVPRPGHVAELDFPVSMTSEIDGTVYLLEGKHRRGMGNVAIELLDLNLALVSTINSSSDGYYIVPAVERGSYHVRVSPAQVREFGLRDPGMRAVTIMPDGKYINGVDFILVKLPGAAPAAGAAADEKK